MNRAVRYSARIGLAVVLLASFAGRAVAQPTTEHGASIVVFPKVAADGTRDTVIHITNTSNSARLARCFYVNGALTDPGSPPGPSNPPLCQVTDFIIKLTAQQPVHWVVSNGRTVPPPCDTQPSLPQCFTDPGAVPPTSASPFEGELLCVEVDQAQTPLPGNALIGEAAVTDLGTGDVATYNAIGFRGFDSNNGDNALCMGGAVNANCPMGAEYEACPQTWTLDHLADGAEDVLVGAGSAVRTNLTVVPCAHDFSTPAPQTVTLQFQITNEMEQLFSATTTVTCWKDAPLIAINPAFSVGTLGSAYAQTRITSSGGFMVVAQEFHDSGSAALTASSIANVHVEGARADGDVILLPQ
jgi:hypothetical protein